ncbi:MAG: hypothetical protein HZB51_06015 [Chloroflexi bacterium]|nr:hypothetical protein [Chloroflexota bacterium]
MQQTPTDVLVAYLIFMVFWFALVAVILILGQGSSRVRDFRTRMLAQ